MCPQIPLPETGIHIHPPSPMGFVPISAGLVTALHTAMSPWPALANVPHPGILPSLHPFSDSWRRTLFSYWDSSDNFLKPPSL